MQIRFPIIWLIALLATTGEGADRRQREPISAPVDGWDSLQDDLSTVKHRLVKELLEDRNPLQDVHAWLSAMAEDGSWPDIDYRDTKWLGWEPMSHIGRILEMGKAWKAADSPLRNDPALKAALDKALAYWLDNDFQARNWHPNKIGVPKLLAQTLLVLEGDLADENREKALEIIRRGRLAGTGANLTSYADVNIMRACIEALPELAAECFRRAAEEIRIAPGDGIQADMSFYQHGRQFYSAAYGVSFAEAAARFAALAHGTAFALPQEKLELLSSFILDGEQWMVVDGRFDYSAYGRGIANPNLSAGFARLIMACERMAEADPGREAEYAAFLKRLRGDADAKPLVGNRSFWRSDYMAHRRPDFFASVRMTSPRVRLVERGVGSNMRGEFLSDGVTFFQRTGKEYDGIFPVWDWRRLPGITSEQKSEPPLVPSAKDRYGERDYAGSVSDGMYGLAAMDFARGPLAARKAWLFLDREIVCLGTGIANTSDTLICTTVNQCLLKGPLTLFEKSRKREAAIGEGTLLPSSWVYHDGIGYVFPEQPGVSWKAETRKGSWGDINLDCPQDEVSADVFSLWIDHGAHPAGAAYHYAVAPGLALEEMDAYAQSPPYVVLSNTPACQAIWSAEAGVLAAAFYEPGSTAAPGVARFSVDQPCLLLARREPPRMGGTAEDVWFVSVSNPACQPLDVAVAIDLEAPAPAASARLLFNLPDGFYAGQSVTRTVDFGG